MRNVVAVDVETSGLVAGLVLASGPNEGAAFEFSLPMLWPSRAEEKALEINGWGKRMFAPMRRHDEAQKILRHYLTDVHIVGKNPSFDAGFLEAFLGERVWHHRLIDIGSMAWGWYNANQDENYRRGRTPSYQTQPPDSERVAGLLGLEVPVRHTALADARWVYEAYRLMVPGAVEKRVSRHETGA